MKNFYKIASIFLASFLVFGILLTCSFNLLSLFFAGIWYSYKHDKSKVQYYLADENHKPISNNRYHRISSAFKDGLYLVSKYRKGYGVVDYNDKVVIPIKYDSITNYGSTKEYIVVEKRNIIRTNSYSKKGLYTYDGKKVLPVKYDSIMVDSDNFRLKEKDTFTVIDRKTKNRIFKVNKTKALNYMAEPEKNPQIYYQRIDLDGKVTLLDEKGKNFINFEYDNLIQTLRYADNYRVFIVEKDNKQGLMNSLGEIILPCEYDEINKEHIENDSAWVKKNDLWGKTNFKQEMLVDYKLKNVPIKIADDIYIFPKKYFKKPMIVEQKPNKNAKKEKATKKYTYKPPVEKRKELKRYEVEGDLHAIEVYKGTYKTEFNNKRSHTLSHILVDVKITDKPITLFLCSYEPVLWKINTKNNGKNIKKIYFMNYHDGDVVVSNKNIPIVKLEEHNTLPDDTLKRERFFNNHFNKKPVSDQYKHQASIVFVSNEPIVDDEKEEKEVEIEEELINIKTNVHQKPKEDTRKAELACFNMRNCIISEDKLSFKHNNKAAFGAWAFSEKSYTSGKKYFEVTVNSKEGKRHKLESENNIGLVAFSEPAFDDPNFYPAYCPFIGNEVFKKRDANCKTVGITDLLPLKNNSTYGIAVDFDAGKMYVSVDGKWVNSDPKTGKTNYRFAPDERTYRAGGEVDRNTTLTFNFGSKKFKYAKPLGYSAYK